MDEDVEEAEVVLFHGSGGVEVGHGDGGEGRRRQEVLVSVGFLAEEEEWRRLERES
jgi:hypothetical protein